MHRQPQECLAEMVVELTKLVLADNDRRTCSRLKAALDHYNEALAEEQAERLRAEQAAIPSKHVSRHWREAH